MSADQGELPVKRQFVSDDGTKWVVSHHTTVAFSTSPAPQPPGRRGYHFQSESRGARFTDSADVASDDEFANLSGQDLGKLYAQSKPI